MAGVQDEAKPAISAMSPLKSCEVEKPQPSGRGVLVAMSRWSSTRSYRIEIQGQRIAHLSDARRSDRGARWPAPIEALEHGVDLFLALGRLEFLQGLEPERFDDGDARARRSANS
jgi:hypothetical protein